MNVMRGLRLFTSIGLFFACLIFALSGGMYEALAEDIAISTSTPPVESQSVATSTEGTGGTDSVEGGTIVTGDATATTTIANTINHGDVSPDTGDDEMNSSTFTSSGTSDAVVGSTASSTAETGDNTIEGGVGTNLIVTGNAVSTANVINEVNTNIFNSDGLILFLNQLFGGGLDLTDYDLSFFFVGQPGASPDTVEGTATPQCTLLTCLNSSSLNVLNTNTATVTNSVIVRAATGDNTATSTDDATIDTGDAYAAANVVNLVNTNIINSSYLLVAFNNFGDLAENITLPGGSFFDKLFASGYASSSINSSTYAVDAHNDVALTGTTTAISNTGNNIASTTEEILATTTPASATSTATGSGTVTTGDAHSSAHSYNQANTTSVGGTSVFLMFRVSGDWSGSVVGLPEGLVKEELQVGNDKIIKFVSRGATSTPAGQLLEEYNSSHFLASSTNTAAVENNVSVEADTGNNEAITDVGSSTVRTGNAYSSASVVNLINTNIVGQNWIFGVFNVFGDMSSDIVFGGSPLLSVEGTVSPNTVAPGEGVTYTFTVTNAGNGSARNVILQTSFDNTLITFDETDVHGAITTTGQSWNLGIIPQGKSRTFSFTAHVGTNFPPGMTATVPLSAAAVNDAITSPITSNTANVALTVTSPSGGGGSGGGGGSSRSSASVSTQSRTSSPSTSSVESSITITKSVAASSTPGYVDYKVNVYNKKTAGPAYKSSLTDTLFDPAGVVMYTRSWDLATIAPGDDITLTYTVAFAASTTPGTYHNVAQVTGRNNSESGKQITVEGAADITLGAFGQVLGAATSTIPVATSTIPTMTICPYLSNPLHAGMSGNLDVVKLQVFLNVFQHESLPTTGFYGPMTKAAVSRFQVAHEKDILAPLGLSTPTGSVYARTLHKINALMCGTS